MERRTALLDSLMTRLRAVPGVSETAFANALPLLSAGGFRAFRMRPPSDPSAEVDVNAMQRVVSPGYFAALGLRLVDGRTLAAGDTMTSPMVIVVNRSFAARYLGPRPVGAFVPNLGMCRGDNDRWAVVGVVDDMRQGSVFDAPQPELFIPYAQAGCAAAVPDPILVIRTADDPGPYAATLKRLIREQAPALALDAVMTMDERVTTNLARPRLYAVVLAAFGAFALAIAGVGVFGVLSYSVAQRSREIGVRAALGARPADIVALVVGQVAAIGVCGLGVGLGTAFVLSRSLAAVLYGVQPHDHVSFLVVAAILAAVTALACVGPARRAARIDPLQVLRGFRTTRSSISRGAFRLRAKRFGGRAVALAKAGPPRRHSPAAEACALRADEEACKSAPRRSRISTMRSWRTLVLALLTIGAMTGLSARDCGGPVGGGTKRPGKPADRLRRHGDVHPAGHSRKLHPEEPLQTR